MADGTAADAAPAEVRVSGEVNRMIQSEVSALYARLEGLRRRARFPSFAGVSAPMVLVLGNHSSGKSTFINHMLGQDVQKTGRAPTDCTFTVLAGGPRAERLDGAALARREALGFGDVRRLFGREFVSQVELKVVKGSALLDDGGLLLVDSPGMIDPPGASHSPALGRADADRDTDRGYDFKRAVQWFAERADVILVMFDPDKPGTTFETLDVLTSSLRGLSSKMLLILNKVDDFRSVHDFARAYGALCWNLSKVIPRKDLPFIYTMYVPQDQRHDAARAAAKKVTTVRTTRVNGEVTSREVVSEQDDASATISSTTTTSDHSAFDVQKMLEHEFDGTRSEVMREVERAPDRATDNVLSLLKATASRLKMHVTLIEACKKEYADLATFWKRVQIAGVVAGVGLVSFYLVRTVGHSAPGVIADAVADSSSSSSQASPSAAVAAPPSPSPSLRGAAPSAGQEWQANWAKQVARSQSTFRYTTFLKLLVSSCASNLAVWKAAALNLDFKRTSVLQWLPATFQRVYAPLLCKSDRLADETTAQWHAVQPGLELALAATPLDEFPPFEPKDTTYLDDVLNLHIPRLDRSVRDRAGDDHAYLRFKHLKHPAAVPDSTRSDA